MEWGSTLLGGAIGACASLLTWWFTDRYKQRRLKLHAIRLIAAEVKANLEVLNRYKTDGMSRWEETARVSGSVSITPPTLCSPILSSFLEHWSPATPRDEQLIEHILVFYRTLDVMEHRMRQRPFNLGSLKQLQANIEDAERKGYEVLRKLKSNCQLRRDCLKSKLHRKSVNTGSQP